MGKDDRGEAAPTDAARVTWLRPAGTSMRRWLSEAGPVPIEAIPFESFRPGDCVAYRAGGKLLLHRVWLAGRRRLWVRDDAAGLPLHKVLPEQVLGRLVLDDWRAGGLPGLGYSLASNAAARIGRILRKFR